MSYIPDCRTDENYNEKYLVGNNKMFIAGFDYAVETILNLFDGNLDVYPKLEELLDDKKAIIADGKVALVKESIDHWAEMQRDEMITGMIDGMDEDEYKKIKAEVDGGQSKEEN